MAPGTPSKGRRVERGHVPFNAKPKEIGTRTGKHMPTNVPLGSDGFEDPSAFFKSPADGLLSTARTTRTRHDFDTPGVGAFITPSHTGKKGRMSALMGSSDDEEDGSRLGRGLLDEDDVLEPHLSSPGPYFSASNPPSVTLPRRSQPVPASPATDFGNLPTPKVRQGRSSKSIGASPGNALSARKSNLNLDSPRFEDAGTFSFGDGMGDFGGGDDFAMDDVAGDSSLAAGRSKSRSLSPIKRKRNSINDQEDEAEVDQDVNPPDSDDGSDAGGGTGFDVADDMDQGDGGVDEAGGDEEGMSLEEEAIARENEQGSDIEDSGEETERPVKRGRPKKNRSASRDTDRAGSQPREKKRTRVSRFGAEEVNEYQGDFVCRRSGRRHFKPLKWWAGERFEYAKGQYQPTITEVVHIPDEPVELPRAKRKRSGRSRSAKPSREESEGVSRWGEEDGWDEETDPVGIVKDFLTDKEIQRRIAYPRHRLEPKPVSQGSFKYQKVFGEDMFIAAGVVYIPVGGSKPGKVSKDNAYIFYVIAGAVQVTIHRTSFIVAPGGMFMVPRGNHYMFENISPSNEVQLFFAQSRKIKASEADEAAIARMQGESAEGDKTMTADNGGEQEDERAETPVPKSAKKKTIKRATAKA